MATTVVFQDSPKGPRSDVLQGMIDNRQAAEAAADAAEAALDAMTNGEADLSLNTLTIGGFAVAKVELPTRAAFEAATIPDWVKEWSFYSHPVPSSYTMKLEFVRDDNGIACESANGVKGSPAGQPTAMHYGIMPGEIIPAGLAEAASADCESRGLRLYFPGAPDPYDVDTHHILHCKVFGDGSAGAWSTGHETVFRSVGSGTAVRWHDYGRAEGAGDVARTMFVFGRSELTIEGVRFKNEGGWEHYVIAPGTRGCSVRNCSGIGASDVGVLFDNTWSDRHTVLMALHPTIRPAAGCNECGVYDCDLQSATFGWGIVGTERDPTPYTSSNWIWGYGGASDFRAVGGRCDGWVLDAACKNAAGMIQSITIDGCAPRIGSNSVMFRLGRVSDLVMTNLYGEASEDEDDPTPARIEVTSLTAASGTGKIIVNNCDIIRATVHLDGVDTEQTLTAGGGGLPFWDITTKSGTRFVYGQVVNEEGVTGTVGIGFTPFGIRPLFNALGSLGTSTREWLTVRMQRLRSNSPRLWIRTKQDGVTEPGLFISVGNSQIRWLFEKNRILAWVPGIARPYSLDGDEVPVDPETASDGLVLSPNNIRPNTSGGAGLGSTSYPWSALRSSTVYTNALVFGATTSGTVRILTGSTSPEGNVAAPVGALYLQDTADGAFSTVWRKATGTGNTGWVSLGRADLVRGRTRAGFAAEVAAGFDPGVGAVIFADGYGYRRVSGATAIADLPGYEPYGDASQDHWGIAVGTDETAKITAMINWTSARGVTVEWGDGPYVFGDYAISAENVLVKWRSRTGKTVLRSNKSVPDGPAYEDDAFVRFNAQTKTSGLLSGGLLAGATQVTLPDTAVAEATAGRSMVSILSDRVIETDDRGQARIGYTAPIERVVSSTVVEIGMPNPVLLHSGTDLGATITAVGADTVTVAAFVGRDVSEMRYRLTFDTVGGSASTVTALPSEFDPDTGTFTLEDVPVGLVVGDTLSIKREISFFLFDGARIDIQGIEFERDYHTGATAGDLGFRGLVIARAKDPIVQNCVFRNFSEGGVRVDSCYGGNVGYLRAINCNRAYGTTDGTGYGVSVFQSSRGAYHHITGFGCRRTLDFGGTQAISWDNTTNEIAGYGGGLAYTGGAFWPSGTIEQSVVGSHGGASRTEYSQSRGHDVKSVALLRGKDEVVRGVYGSGKITELLRSYLGDGCNASGFYYTDERPDWISDPDLYAKGSRNGKLETCITIVGTIQPDRQFAFSDFHIRGVRQSVVSLLDAPVIGSLVLGGVIDIAIDDEENNQSTFWYIRNSGTGSATINGIVDMGRPCIRTKGSTPKKTTWNWMAFTNFVLPDGVPVKMPNGEVRFYLSDDAVAKFPVQRNGCGVLDLRTVAAGRPQWCQGIMLTVSGRQYTAGVFSGMDFLGVVLTGTTGTDGNVNVAYTPAGGENVLYVENRRGAREMFTMRFSELAL